MQIWKKMLMEYLIITHQILLCLNDKVVILISVTGIVASFLPAFKQAKLCK